MKAVISVLVFAPTTALAHDSLAPHTHPHGFSLLPDGTSFVIGALLVGGVYLAVRWLKG